MLSVIITAKGQVTHRKELLDHLGVGPGDRIAVELLPDGRASVRAQNTDNSIKRLFGFLKKEGEAPLSLDEIDKIIIDGWARRRR